MSVKISEFTSQSVQLSDEITFIRPGSNFRTSVLDLSQVIGTVGSIASSGALTSTPVLYKPAPGENVIRAIRGGAGIYTQVGPEDEILLSVSIAQGDNGGAQVLASPSLNPLIKSLKGGTGVSVTDGGTFLQINASEEPIPSNTIIVNSLEDLPAPVNGKITLGAFVYVQSSDLDVADLEIELSAGTSYVGSSLVGVVLTGNGNRLFTSTAQNGRYSVTNLNIQYVSGTVFDFASNKTATAIVENVIIDGCQRVSNMSDMLGVSIRGAIANNVTSDVHVFSGDNQIVNIDAAFVNGWSGSIVALQAATFDIINIENINVVSTSGANILVSGLIDSGNINAGGHGCLRSVSVVGPYVPTQNIERKDLRWWFFNNVGLQNTRNAGYLAMPTNPTFTAISAVDTPVKVAGVWTEKTSLRFTSDVTGRLTYVGDYDISVRFLATMSIDKASVGTSQYTACIAKNGQVIPDAIGVTSIEPGDPQSVAINAEIDVSKDDFIELFVENNTDTDDARVFAANITAEGF